MTFQAFETSQEQGRPAELFEFSIGAEIFRYTSSQLDVILLGGITYDAIPISRGALEQTAADPASQRLEVNMPADNEFVMKFIKSAPGQRATATLKKVHLSDSALETITEFKGTVRNVSFKDDGRSAVLIALPLTSAARRTIPRFTYAGLCNHMLYDSRCKISKDAAAFRLDSTVTAVSGNDVTVSGAAAKSGSFADFFVGGYVEFEGDFRMVTAQSGDVLTLLLPFARSPLNEMVITRAGCKLRPVEDCTNKFANMVNFGGFPYVPKKNIFETGLD